VTPSALEAALGYAEAGWAVLPVAAKGKHPLTRHGVHDASVDASEIGRWWRRWPGANVGIATGARSGVAVVDVDVKGGGRASVLALDIARHVLPPTRLAFTGGGGYHLYFRQPAKLAIPNTVGRLPNVGPAPGVDLRGDGGYVVAPPSVHASGIPYQWHPAPLMPLPAWACAPAAPERRPPAHVAPPATRTRAYGSAALARELASVRTLPVGRRNDGLNRAAFSLGRLVGGGHLQEGVVCEALLAAALATGLDEREAKRTIRSGLGAGKAVPRRAAVKGDQRGRLGS